MKEDRAIVALDQENAYDKIAHCSPPYVPPLGPIHKYYAIPISEHTFIVVNGMLSMPYGITRGIRRGLGDPLTCILFSLRIEPLATSL